MIFSRRSRVFWSVLLTVFLTNIPYVASAEVIENQMIPTSAVIDQMSRAEAQAKVQRFLSRADVQAEFLKRGVSAEEANMRIASLSEQELNRLANQMDQVKAGGDVFGILIVVLVVLLIIYLAKRI